jgi:hypothetical protein
MITHMCTLLRFTDSDYPFDIFKLFLVLIHKKKNRERIVVYSFLCSVVKSGHIVKQLSRFSFFTHDFHIFYRFFNISLLSHEIMLFFLKIMWIYDQMKKFIFGLKTVNSVLYLPVNVLYHLHRH